MCVLKMSKVYHNNETANSKRIFIDLISVDLLDEFFSLPIDIHTTDFVIHELTEPLQQKKVESYIKTK